MPRLSSGNFGSLPVGCTPGCAGIVSEGTRTERAMNKNWFNYPGAKADLLIAIIFIAGVVLVYLVAGMP